MSLVTLDERQVLSIQAQARIVAQSGMAGTTNADEAAYLMLRAVSFGLDPWAGPDNLYIFTDGQGKRKLLISAILLHGLARRAGNKIEWLSDLGDIKLQSARLRRVGEQNWTTLTYRIEDAQRAGLANKNTWTNHPAAMLRAATIRGLVKATVPEVVLGIALPADDVTVDLDSEFPDELGGIDNEEGAGLAVDGEVTATASPARPNAVADRIRAQLLENVQNLAPAVAAGVRDHMRNLQMPPIAHADFTKADAALVRRLIDECEAEQERIDSGYPVPDAVQDAQPEANYTEPGSEKYDPADAGIEGGEPFTEEEA